MTEITLGGVPLETTKDAPTRFSMLLWGLAKCGKTTLAGTAPGQKLWINFDPDGLDSLRGREDITFADYSSTKPGVIVPKCINDNCLDLAHFLKAHSEIETVVVDSITFFTYKAQEHTCTEKGLKFEEPGQRGYTVKNNYTNKFVRNINTICKEAGVNIIFIAHENAPEKDEKGNVLGIGLALSPSLATAFSALPSEVWHVRDDNAKRFIAVRPCRLRSPMGSRMFDASTAPEFQWKYDAVVNKGQGITDWFNAWKQRGHKIPLPS